MTFSQTSPGQRLQAQAQALIAAWDYPAAVRLLADGYAQPSQHTTATVEQIAVLYLHTLRETGQTVAGVALGEPLFDDATNRHGLTHPVTVQILAVLGELYHDIGRLDDADDCYHLVALSSADYLAGPAVRRTAANRALLRYDRGQHQAAIADLSTAHTALHRFDGAADPDTLRTATDLARLLHRHGATADAHRLLTHSLAAARAGLADQHPLTALLAHDLAALRHPLAASPPTDLAPTTPAASTGRTGAIPVERRCAVPDSGRPGWSPRPAVLAWAGALR